MKTAPKLVAVGQITHSIEEVTPAMAERMLEKNSVNRDISKPSVDQYARSMASGLWLPSVIWIDTEGNIIDGQHRLTAVVQSGHKIKFIIVRNAPKMMQDVLDTGKKRTIKDVLSFKGEENAQQLGAIARLVNLVVTQRIGLAQMNLSNEELLGTIEMYPDMRPAAEIAEWAKYNRAFNMNPSVIGTAWWLIARKFSADEATRFINRVCTLVGEREGSPILALNKRVSEMRKNNQRFSVRDQLAVLLKVWNYDATGRSIRSITVRGKDGKFNLPDIKPRQYEVDSGPMDFGFQGKEGSDE